MIFGMHFKAFIIGTFLISLLPGGSVQYCRNHVTFNPGCPFYRCPLFFFPPCFHFLPSSYPSFPPSYPSPPPAPTRRSSASSPSSNDDSDFEISEIATFGFLDSLMLPFKGRSDTAAPQNETKTPLVPDTTKPKIIFKTKSNDEKVIFNAHNGEITFGGIMA
ncbi:uncharacterized protein LOC111056358 isoform X1 [Nilaparvata lugens]|uniref:uncharacterized protein LOC111056358 isoform X1 n=1 Tax=Nilaparvata lugens TaxID=108931 RepID=UPI00193E8C9C|nr:uncharacterized protein LOC111056358 isoform X1 [Nilaparvata lugens]